MSGFIVAAGGMLAGGLGFVVPPLWRKQRALASAIAVLLPLAAVSLYVVLGNPNGLRPVPEAVAEVGPAQVEQMVSRLAARLAQQPDDAAGWRMLARSYETLRRFDQAADAYRHLLALEPDNPDVMVDYAVVLGMTANSSLVGEPEALLAKALALNPNHLQALALSGSAALERGDVANAVKPWKKILALVPADSDIGRSIAASIAKAQAR
ncbi:cytochrome c-type biogenesis protein CcmH [Duganella sp. CF402]|uniref:tetratricopeptide repeat protein n=1 Tax=unclassified Duganella TaxID=2636909 RepID=UPI0008BCB9E4|nr:MULTISPECIES: tetratricopeptide repeat protein [unclassified Duganella]RZT04459.1 cytochrome c-type biogenesis protein CcmH [Duganella sp. BK701]SEM35713.1 cytochrome c-type biogenesis protein CcmH [Duganella sp. CF402]